MRIIVMSKYRKVIYPRVFLFCLGIAGVYAAVKKDSEVKDTSEPVHRFSGRYNNGDERLYRYLNKRQISQQFRSLSQSQFFSQPFDDTASIDFNADSPSPPDDRGTTFNRRPVFASQDEEERFFLSRETTTLNPLSFFIEQTTTTTLDPIEQQRVEEQRRFQEEIANKGLREQQQNLFTTRTTSTTTTTSSTDLLSIEQLLSDPTSFQRTDLTSPTTEVVQQSLLDSTFFRPPSGRFSQSVQTPAQSYSFVRTFRRRRSHDLQPSGNEIDDLTVSSTASPQEALVRNLLQDTNPGEDLVKIGGWLVDNLAKTVERNIAKFAESAVKQRSIVKASPYSAPANLFLPDYKSTPKPVKILSNPDPPPNFIPSEYNSSPKPVKNLVIPELGQLYLQEVPPNSKLVNNLLPIDPNLFQEYQSTPRLKDVVSVNPNNFHEYQSTSKPVQLFHSPELPSNPLPITFAETTPKIDVNQFQWTVSPAVSYDWRPESLLSQSQPTKLETISYPTSTIRTSSVVPTSIFIPQSSASSITAASKTRNIQILPTSTIAPEENHSSSLLRSAPVYNNFDRRTTPRLVETTTVYAPAHAVTSTENEASITSLFKAKLNSIKDTKTQEPSVLQKSFSETQQPDQLFDLLAQSNVTASPYTVYNENNTPVYSTVTSITPSTAIFVRTPENEPSSTAGYIFDKTINAKSKKENSNYVSKKYNRSPQMLKSTLVYRTPPGKRATLARSELAKNEEMEAGLLAHILEAQGKPISSWLLGQTRPTTTSRPFVTALMNLIRKRSPVH